MPKVHIRKSKQGAVHCGKVIKDKNLLMWAAQASNCDPTTICKTCWHRTGIRIPGPPMPEVKCAWCNTNWPNFRVFSDIYKQELPVCTSCFYTLH